MPRKRKRAAKAIRIQDLDLDEQNIDEMAAHELTVDSLDQILDNRPRFRRNKRNRTATHQMVGPDDGGRFWVVCIAERGPEFWRPITGWPASDSDIEWWRRSQ
jgi:hypothetical protein